MTSVPLGMNNLENAQHVIMVQLLKLEDVLSMMTLVLSLKATYCARFGISPTVSNAQIEASSMPMVSVLL